MIKIVKEHTGFHYSSTKIQLYQEVLKKIKGKSITHNIFRIQDNESIICGFYCSALIYACGKNFIRLC